MMPGASVGSPAVTARLILLLVLIAALAGCGGGEQTAAIPSGDEPTSASTATTETETETTEAPPRPGRPTAATRAIARRISDNTRRKPRIGRPRGNPPEQLVIHDIAAGRGAAAESGDQVTVDYAGVSWSTGVEFDASWGKQEFPFELGAGAVIPGWDQGVAGMKVGGRRLLVIPPDLGYGAQGQPPDIGPNETLVFVVDLRKIG